MEGPRLGNPLTLFMLTGQFMFQTPNPNWPRPVRTPRGFASKSTGECESASRKACFEVPESRAERAMPRCDAVRRSF